MSLRRAVLVDAPDKTSWSDKHPHQVKVGFIKRDVPTYLDTFLSNVPTRLRVFISYLPMCLRTFIFPCLRALVPLFYVISYLCVLPGPTQLCFFIELCAFQGNVLI